MKQTLLSLLVVFATHSLQSADSVFSGPQIGEKTTPFSVLELWGPNEGTERDPILENRGRPTALVFVNGIERSLVPLLRAVDQYGAARSELINTEVIFLFADRVQGEQRIKAAAGSLRLNSRIGLSLDGAEGPGNYGLNKDCMMTLITAKGNTVVANFALVQPGIANAPKVIEALARTCDDPNPPGIEELTERPTARRGEGRQMARPERPMQRGRAESPALSQLDLNSEEGLRAAVRGLIVEVQQLRAELDKSRGVEPQPEAQAEPAPDRFPGAVPDDPKLNSLLRQVIRQSNDQETVDRVIADMEAYVQGNEELTKQAIDGWTRVLHFGDRYGTAHARTSGQAFLEKLQAR